jgi:hypothetical protein
MQRAGLLLAATAIAAGCGGSLTPPSSRASTGSLGAYGMSVNLPAGWNGRIVLGASGRPVLHAATFPLTAGDNDEGEVAKEAIGTAPAVYVNVRDLGPEDALGSFSIPFSASDFDPVPPAEGMLTQAHRDVAASDELYRITVLSGGDEPPSESMLQETNNVLRSLALEPYVPTAVPSLPPDAERLHGYGISMSLPPGWNGRVTRGELDAASADSLGPDDIRLRLLEHATNGGFVARRVPISLTPAEFVPPVGESDPNIPAMTGGSFVDQGRYFVLWVDAGSFPPSAEAVEQANAALATLTVEPGDFYPGTVEPATFGPVDGWHTGTSGSTDARPDGQQTFTWASTVPYRDEPFQFAPHKTLAALPPDGIAIDVQLFGPDDRAAGVVPPFRVGQAEEPGSFEGVDSRDPLYAIRGRASGQKYDVEISVFFGRPHPTADQIAAANAELARLRLPDWTAAD